MITNKKYAFYAEGKTGPVFEENHECITEQLLLISNKLYELLPDPSINVEERLERMSRVIKGSQLNSTYHKSARHKLNYLKYRLDELIPGDYSLIDKIQHLEELAYKMSGNKEFKNMCDRLQYIGDNRISDIGR